MNEIFNFVGSSEAGDDLQMTVGLKTGWKYGSDAIMMLQSFYKQLPVSDLRGIKIAKWIIVIIMFTSMQECIGLLMFY